MCTGSQDHEKRVKNCTDILVIIEEVKVKRTVGVHQKECETIPAPSVSDTLEGFDALLLEPL